MPKRETRPPGPATLWVVAVAFAIAAAAWQWQTGGGGAVRGEVEISGRSVPYRVAGATTAGELMRVTVAASPEVTGTVRWRRSRREKAFQALTLLRDGDVLVGLVPTQPAGTWIECQLVLAGPSGLVRVPADGPVETRFLGRVSSVLVLLYLAAAFLTLALGVRAGLSAAFERPETRRLAWATAAASTLGGIVLGPLVQNATFGTYWSGWPLGPGTVDSKALVVWLAWAVAAATTASARDARDRFARTIVILATAILMAVSLLPHSLHLSRLTNPSPRGTAGIVVGYSTDGSEGRPSSS